MGGAVIRALALVALIAATVSAQRASPAGARTVAIGDVHGNADAFIEILAKVGLIDASHRWAGGTATFVQTGDVTDRGPRVRASLDLLMSLEEEAPASGGRVIPLLGNHETMNLLGDLHDVPPEAYASFADDTSEERRQRAYTDYAALCRARQAALPAVPPVYQLPSKDAWMNAHPPGYLEYVEAFGPKGRYGRWLRSRMIAVQVGDTLFLHGGISQALAGEKPDDLNRRVQRELRNFDDYREHLVDRKVILPWFNLEETLQAVRAEVQAVAAAAERQSTADLAPGGLLDPRHAQVLREFQALREWLQIREDGPLWFRGYATWSPEEGAQQIQGILEQQRVKRIVVGHTIPSSMRITPRFQRRVFLIDTGMLSSAYKGGRASALEIREGRVTAEYMDSTITLDPPSASVEPDDQKVGSPSRTVSRLSGVPQWVDGMFGR